jgi:ATP-dependent Lhr-like helicase
VALLPRDDASLLHPPLRGPQPADDDAVVAALTARGAMFFRDLAAATGEPDRALLAHIWELVWAGVLTNDAWHPLRGGTVLRAVPEPPAASRLRRRGARPTSSFPAARGRWSLVADLLAPAPAPRERARVLAETLLDRHGVVTRAGVLAEGVPGGYSSVYGELRLMEEAGACQRGYFVEGLGGAQFALPAAVERLRDVREAGDERGAVVLSAVDPANPYGAAVPWPDAVRKLQRVAGAWVVLVAGRLALYVERGGRGLVTVDAALLEPALSALGALVADGRVRRLAPERIDGEPIAGTDAERVLVASGFLQGHRRVVMRR